MACLMFPCLYLNKILEALSFIHTCPIKQRGYNFMSVELKCSVNSVALTLMLASFISYSLRAVLACQHGGVNRMSHVTAGALY